MSIPLQLRQTTDKQSPYVVKDINGTTVFYAKYEHEAKAFIRGVQYANRKTSNQ